MSWSARVKQIVGFATVALVALAFAVVGGDVAPFVFPVIALGFGLSLLRARKLERDTRARDSWRRGSGE